MRASDRGRLIRRGSLQNSLKRDTSHPPFRQPEVVCYRLQTIADLRPLPNHALPEPDHLKYPVALDRPPPDLRKLVMKQKLQDELSITPIILVSRRRPFPYQNRVADKKLMTRFKEHVLEPGSSRRSLDADYCWFGKRRIKLPDYFRIMLQILRLRFACFRIAPGDRLLMWM